MYSNTIYINKIIKQIYKFYQTDSEKVRNNKLSRKRENVLIRQKIMYILFKNFKNLSLNEIAKITGKKSHATVLHSIKTIKNLIETNNSSVLELSELEGFLEKTIKFKKTFFFNREEVAKKLYNCRNQYINHEKN